MWTELLWAAVLGLMLGSFANVVIHRLPLMLEQAWAADCHPDAPRPPRFDLLWPRSHCPHCHTPLSWRDLWPVLSYLLARGHCRHCHHPISARYMWVELAMAGVFAGLVTLHGWTLAAVLWCAWGFVLVCAATIDARTTLLPDALTLPLLWLGLLSASFGWIPVQLDDALWAAALGYGVLRGTYHLFKALTGKEGMGFGDFKLLAALGAWTGMAAVMPMLLLASVLGVLYGGTQWALGRLQRDQAMPFGPFLVTAAALHHLYLYTPKAWPWLQTWLP